MPEVVSTLIFIIFMIPTPLGSMLILICDLGTELLPAIAFSYEPPEEDLMLVPPRKVLTTPQAAKQLSSPTSIGNNDQNRMTDVIVIDIPNEDNTKSTKNSLVQVIKKWWSKYFEQKITGEVLVDNEMLLWCFLQGGLIESVACIAGYLLTFAWYHVPIGKLAYSPYFTKSSPTLLLTNGSIVWILFFKLWMWWI